MSLVILTGASGAGKTTIARALQARHPGEAEVHFFDSIGVPPVEEMIAAHGSPERWQSAMTIAWIARLADRAKSGADILLEGQMRPSFVVEAARAAGLDDYRLVLIDCDNETRRRRLCGERGQPELDNPDMTSWSAYLREAMRAGGHAVIDTGILSVDEAIASIRSCFRAR